MDFLLETVYAGFYFFVVYDWIYFLTGYLFFLVIFWRPIIYSFNNKKKLEEELEFSRVSENIEFPSKPTNKTDEDITVRSIFKFFFQPEPGSNLLNLSTILLVTGIIFVIRFPLQILLSEVNPYVLSKLGVETNARLLAIEDSGTIVNEKRLKEYTIQFVTKENKIVTVKRLEAYLNSGSTIYYLEHYPRVVAEKK